MIILVRYIPVIEDGSTNDGPIVEGFFEGSLLSPVWLLGYSPVHVYIVI